MTARRAHFDVPKSQCSIMGARLVGPRALSSEVILCHGNVRRGVYGRTNVVLTTCARVCVRVHASNFTTLFRSEDHVFYNIFHLTI